MGSSYKQYTEPSANLRRPLRTSEGDCRSISKIRANKGFQQPLARSTPKSPCKCSNVSIKLCETEELNKHESNVSTKNIICTQTEKYKPIPYTFRIPSNTIPVTNGHIVAKCPPFYIQVDHALAVIWSLFSKESTQRPLGVAQLHWAVSFLRGIRNNKGKQPKDVAVCIEAIEDALIRQYSEMADTIKPPTNLCSCLGKSNTLKIQPLSSAIKTPKNDTKHKTTQLIGQKLPFSVTYAEMIKQKPNHLEQLFKAKRKISGTEIDLQHQISSLKKIVSSDNSQITLDACCSKENMVDFLKTWRKEQIGKIQDELHRLHSIETFMGNMGKEDFKPYLDNQQIDSLVSQKVKTGPSSFHTQPTASCISNSKKRSRTTRIK